MRLNQFLAKNLGISRRKADVLIGEEKVRINGKVAILGTQVAPEDNLEIFKNGKFQKIFQIESSRKIVLLYKPPMVVTTKNDPEGRRTIYDLLPQEFQSYKSAGRLDYMSQGLLVLSENGNLILSLTHPKFKTKKTYLVSLKNSLLKKQIDEAQRGEIVIDDYKLNPVKITPAKLLDYKFLELNPRSYLYLFELTEGRNRQIRKMIIYFQNQLEKLVRISHGPFKLSPEIVKKGYKIESLIGSHVLDKS